MINILVHGLGQDEKSWNEVKNQLNNNGINVETPNLFSIVKNLKFYYKSEKSSLFIIFNFMMLKNTNTCAYKFFKVKK